MQANIRENAWENRRKNHDGARTKHSYSGEDLFDVYYKEYKVLLFLSKTLLLLFLSTFPFFLVYLVLSNIDFPSFMV